MSDEQEQERQAARNALEQRLAGMTTDELRDALRRQHADIAGLNRRITELHREREQRPDSAAVEAQRTAERLEIKERIYEDAMSRNLPLGAVRRLHVDVIDDVPMALDEVEDALKGRQAEERRAFDAAHGRTSATMGPKKQYGAGSYADLLQMDSRQLEYMSPGALDHIMNRELSKKGAK